MLIAKVGNTTALYRRAFTRLDTGITVPNDGYRYFMAQHEYPLFGTTRHSENQTNQREPRPAVVNTKWGYYTEAKVNGDYVPLQDHWQRWYRDFWDKMSGEILPMGEKIGTYVNPMNPNLIFTEYTPGSLLSLYAGMIKDAKSHSDSASPETGFRDVVTGRNLSNPRPYEWLCRPCTGALLRVDAVLGTKLRIKCIDLNQPPPDVNTLEPWQYYFGTQVHIDGTVTRYPDVKEAFEVHGLPPAGTAMPNVAPGGYFMIDKNKCVELQPGQIWKPYYP